MKRKLKFLALALGLLPALTACFKSGPDWGPAVTIDDKSVSHDMIVLGDKMEDPYSLENMTKALVSLYGTKADRDNLTATDYYVRFLPENESQMNRLSAMGFEILDHPVDYQVIREGDYYHDPSLPDDSITWQYAVVPNNLMFPSGIRYEKLDDCYIAEHDDLSTKSDFIDWKAVERESFRLTGNGHLLTDALTKGESGVAPSGRISIVDPQVDDEPVGVKGVKISCNTFVKFASAYTDDEGYYSIDKEFNSDVRYRIIFKNQKGFGIGLNKLLVPASASTLGKQTPAGVSLTVTEESDRRLFSRCVANNAAYDYLNACSEGSKSISTPPSNLRIWLFQGFEGGVASMLQQGVLIDNTQIGEMLGDYATLVKMFLPDLIIGLKSKDSYSSIYTFVQHFLAHASHFMVAGKSWWDKFMSYSLISMMTSDGNMYGSGSEEGSGYGEVAEMWAFYMQTVLYREHYDDDATVFGTSSWFYPQILLFLDERGLGRFELFNALGPDIIDREIMQEKLLALYPEERGTINQAFARYN